MNTLAVELLYDIQLYANSPSLPYISKYYYNVFNHSPLSFRAQYLLARTANSTSEAEILTKVLRYPICTIPVLDILYTRLQQSNQYDTSAASSSKVELPRRLFRPLVPPKSSSSSLSHSHSQSTKKRNLHSQETEWSETDEPLPFLNHIITSIPSFPPLEPNANQGYALTKAVHARHIPLIRFLLDLGASPACKSNMAVTVAIKQRNLPLVQMLVERDDRDGIYSNQNDKDGEKSNKVKSKGKKRRLMDRIEVDSSMLKLAVKCNAKDIIDWLAWEKGVIPDMQTLQSLRL